VAAAVEDDDVVALLVAVDDKHACTSACSRCEEDRRHCGIGGAEEPDLPGNGVGWSITSSLACAANTFHKSTTSGKDKSSNPSKTVRRKMPLVLDASTDPSCTAACKVVIKSSKAFKEEAATCSHS